MSVSGKGGRSRGAVTGLSVLLLPILMIAVCGLMDIGTIVLARNQLQTAADFGALAAVQHIDLDRLATGERWLVEGEAIRAGQDWTRANLERMRPILDQQQPEVTVTVYNVLSAESLRHGRTGRTLVDPTVCVEITARIRLPVGLLNAIAEIEVWADASVLAPGG